MSKKRILITGATGFVGRNLVFYMENLGVELRLLTRDELNSPNPDIFNEVDTVVHLAGKAHDLKHTSAIDEYYFVNYELTKKLYDAFLKSDATRFIFLSSVKAAADAVGGILTEQVVPLPKTHYGKSKLLAEDFIQSQILPSDKSYFILRPCMIHGPGNKGNLNLLYQFVKKDIPYPLAGFENRRSFLSVENLCFVISELINASNLTSGIYNVADDESLSTNDVVKVLAQSLGKKAKLWRIPNRLIAGLAKIGNILKLPLNTERLNKLTEDYVVSNLKLINALKIKLPISSVEGLKKTADSFKSPS